MNYFELFDLPISLSPDPGQVKRRFYELSRQYHPDFHAGSLPEEKAGALTKSADINKALGILSNREQTIKYVLELRGLLEAEEKYQLPPAFLMEMMDLNEEIAETGSEGQAAIRQKLKEAEAEIYEPVASIIANWREGESPDERLLPVKEYYFKKKYLQRLAGQLAGM